jgi:hypothetical protein
MTENHPGNRPWHSWTITQAVGTIENVTSLV